MDKSNKYGDSLDIGNGTFIKTDYEYRYIGDSITIAVIDGSYYLVKEYSDGRKVCISIDPLVMSEIYDYTQDYLDHLLNNKHD